MLSRRELREFLAVFLTLLALMALGCFVVAVTSRPPAPLSVWEPGH